MRTAGTNLDAMIMAKAMHLAAAERQSVGTKR